MLTHLFETGRDWSFYRQYADKCVMIEALKEVRTLPRKAKKKYKTRLLAWHHLALEIKAVNKRHGVNL